jgi:single-strand DNA-binding protein
MASRSVNKVILLGNLGRDAETRFTPSGIAKTTFSVATSRRWKDQQTGDWKEETDWHNIVLWRSENLAQYLTKGKTVYVEGRLQTRNYEDKDGQKKYITEVVADEVILAGSRGDSAPSGGGGASDEYSQEPRHVSMPRSAGGSQRGPAAPASGGGAHPGPRPVEPDLEHGITDDDVPF